MQINWNGSYRDESDIVDLNDPLLNPAASIEAVNRATLEEDDNARNGGEGSADTVRVQIESETGDGVRC